MKRHLIWTICCFFILAIFVGFCLPWKAKAQTKVVVIPLDTSVGGSGSAGYIPKFTDQTTLGNSVIYEINGKIGIGTSNPTSSLTIDTTGLGGDEARRMIKMIPGGSQGRVYIASSVSLLDFLQTDSSDSYEDYLTLTAKSFSVSSSKRLKKNIKPIEGALDKVQRLTGVSYDWKADGKHNIGLIAEDVGEVIPEVVKHEKNGQDARSVDYGSLVALLIEATKEQQKEIEVLKRKIADLEK
jgi:hypothetical protein